MQVFVAEKKPMHHMVRNLLKRDGVSVLLDVCRGSQQRVVVVQVDMCNWT